MPDPELEIVVEPEQKDEGELPVKEVELEKPKEAVKAVETPQVDMTEITKALKRMEFQARNFEKARRELDELKSSLSNMRITTEQKSEEPQDELDEIAQKDWKKAVRMLAQEELRTLARERQEEEKKNTVIQELENSKQKVRERYPSIDDENSSEARAFMEILNENPKFLSNPYGPELAMYKMEERMKHEGRLPPEAKAQVEKEINRRARAGANSIPVGRGGIKPNTYTLTQDQKAYCDFHGIPYEQYARTAKQLETGESLEV